MQALTYWRYPQHHTSSRIPAPRPWNDLSAELRTNMHRI
jgi:hypothetical protein